MINQELPVLINFRLTSKIKEDKIIQAEEFLSNLIKRSKSKYKVEDYSMQIVNSVAYFTLK